jgi:hypothetical protein
MVEEESVPVMPPQSACHLRTLTFAIDDRILHDSRRKPERVIFDALTEAGFQINLPYSQFRDVEGLTTWFRQQFLVLPNGDEYICVKRGPEPDPWFHRKPLYTPYGPEELPPLKRTELRELERDFQSRTKGKTE